MLRARLEVLAPDVVKGAHAAVATIVPFYLAGALHEPSLAWVALGGWFGSLADPGGPWRTRALAALAFIVLGGAAVTLAHVAAATTASAALVLAAFVFTASLAPALGSNATSLGNMIAIAATVAASRPGAPTAGLMFALGATWATLSGALMWPVWPHVPLRTATARVFERLADYVDAIAAGVAPGEWAALARTHQRAVRAAVESARETALALRARRTGESVVGANLRVALGAAEGIFFRVIALAEAVERETSRVPPDLAPALRAIARDLYTRRPGPPVGLAGTDPLSELTRSVAELAQDLDRARVVTPPPAQPAPTSRRTLRDLRDAISPRGPILLHAIRVAVLAAVTIAIGRTLTPVHPTWIPVTAIAVLQPYLGATVIRAVERSIGTMFGAALALVLVVAVPSPLVLTIVLFPLCVAAVVTRPRSYRLFVVFLTPVFVVLTDISGANWQTAGARIIDVVIGGVLAFIAAVIAPSHERPRLADALAAVLAALRHYAQLATDSTQRDAIVAARRQLGLALERAEASLERMLAEPAPLRHRAEDAMYLVTYARRLSASLTDLLEHGATIPTDVSEYLVAVIDRVDAHIAARDALPPLPSPPHAPERTAVLQRAELLAQLAGRQPHAPGGDVDVMQLDAGRVELDRTEQDR